MDKSQGSSQTYNPRRAPNDGPGMHDFYDRHGVDGPSYHNHQDRANANMIYRKMVEDEEAAIQRKELDSTPINAPSSSNLTINTPGDKFEKEADSIADKVAGSSSSQATKSTIAGQVPDIQAKGDTNAPPTGFASKLNSTKGAGEPLPDSFRSTMEKQTGKDLSNVRVHTDSNAAGMAEDINAKAFTHGQDVYGPKENLSHNKPSSKHTLAHEVGHTLQQGTNGSQQIQRRLDPKIITRRFRRRLRRLGFYNTTPRMAIRGYKYLKSLSNADREAFYEYAETDEAAKKALEQMEENLPIEFMNTNEFGYHSGTEPGGLDGNPAMKEMINSDDTWTDMGRLDILLTMITQADLGEDVAALVEQRRAKINTPEVDELVKKHGFKEGKYKPEKALFYTRDNMLKLGWNYFTRTKPKTEVDGLIKNYREKSPRATVIGLPLPIIQKSMSGHVSGVEFADYDKGEKPKKPKGETFNLNEPVGSVGTISFDFDAEEGKLLLNAKSLPFDTMNFLFDTLTARVGQGTMDQVIGQFFWTGTNSTHGQKSSKIELGTLELNNLLSVYPTEMYGLGKILLTNAVMTINQPLGVAAELPSWYEAIPKAIYHLMDALYILLESIFLAVDKLLEGVGAGAGQELEEILAQYDSDVNLKITFDSLEIQDFIHSSMGAIDSISIGKTSIESKYEPLEPYYLEKINFIEKLAARENRPLTDSEKKRIEIYRKKIAAEQEAFAQYDQVKKELESVDPNDAERKAELKDKLAMLQQSMPMGTSMSVEKGERDHAIDIQGIRMSTYPTKKPKKTKWETDITQDNLFSGEGGKLQTGDLNIGITANPSGLVKTSLDVPIDTLSLDRFRTEVNGFIIESVGGNIAKLENGHLNLTFDFFEDTGKIDTIKIDKTKVGKVEMHGMRIINRKEKKELYLPPTGLISLSDLEASNLTIMMPREDQDKIQVAGLIQDGELSEPGNVKAGKSIIGLESADDFKDPENMTAAFSFVWGHSAGTVGIYSGSLDYDPLDADAYAISVTDPEFFLKAGDMPGFVSGFYIETPASTDGRSTTPGKAPGTEAEKLWVQGKILNLDPLGPYMKAEKITYVHNPKAKEDGKTGADAISETVMIENPEFESFVFETFSRQDYQKYIVGEKVDRWHKKKDSRKWTIDWENVAKGNLKFKVDGKLYAELNEEKNAWIFSAKSDEGDAKVALSDGQIDLEHTQEEKRKDKTDGDNANRMKYLDMDFLDGLQSDITINIFGQKITVPVEEGGFVNFIPQLQEAYNLLLKEIDKSALGHSINVVEEKLISIIKGAGFTSFTWWMLDDVRKDIKAPMQDMKKNKFSMKLDGKYVYLVVSGPGEEGKIVETSQIPIAYLWKGNEWDADGGRVKVSALSEYVLNNFPQREIKENWIQRLIGSYVIDPFFNTTREIKDSKTFGGWVQAANELTEPTDAHIRSEVVDWWKNEYNLDKVRKKELPVLLANRIIPYIIMQVVKIVQSSNLSIDMLGSLDVGAENGEDAKAGISMTTDDLLNPTITMSGLTVPPFESNFGGNTLSAGGMEMQKAVLSMDHKEEMKEPDKFTLKITEASMTNPLLVVPRKHHEKDKQDFEKGGSSK